MLDLTAKTPPPLKKSPASTSARKPAAKPSKIDERTEAVNGLFQLGGGVALMFGQWADAGACSTHGPNISRELASVAEKNERIGNLVDYLTAVGPYAGLLTAVLPFALQLLVNHGRMPAHPALSQIGVMPSETLANKAQAEVLELQAKMAQEMADAQRAQQEANERLKSVS